MSSLPRPVAKGRGAQIQPANPQLSLQTVDDLAEVAHDAEYVAKLRRPPTSYLPDDSKSIVSQNDSPDIGFRFSVNPYRGCSHGCSYCYARTTHEYLGFTAGLDFETKVMVKHRAPGLFRDWLARPNWRPELIAFSGVTDCYQPAERQFELTRGCVQVAAECRQPIGIVTKNALVTRDLDMLAILAAHRAVRVWMSITTLRAELAGQMEPRTSTPPARLRAIRELSAGKIPTGVMIAPVIPGLNDSEIPAILTAAREAGARSAGFMMLRLSGNVAPVFLAWLQRVLPEKAAVVESRIRAIRSGRLNDAQFGQRQRGTGPIAEQIRQTFNVFARKLGFEQHSAPLNADAFLPPSPSHGQRRLF